MHGLMRSAVLKRVAPMLVFMVLLALRGWLVDPQAGIDPRWLYGLQVVLVGGLLAWAWREYGELSPQLRPSGGETALAVLVGLGLFVAWIFLDAPWMTIGQASATFKGQTAGGQLDWVMVVMRTLGAVLVVPLMEELFWRSFLMRWVDDPQFERVAPASVTGKAMVLSTFGFVLVHNQWLAAAMAGLAYAWLYKSTGKLWVAIVAHATTNAALAVWVVSTGQWQFW